MTEGGWTEDEGGQVRAFSDPLDPRCDAGTVRGQVAATLLEAGWGYAATQNALDRITATPNAGSVSAVPSGSAGEPTPTTEAKHLFAVTVTLLVEADRCNAWDATDALLNQLGAAAYTIKPGSDVVARLYEPNRKRGRNRDGR